MIIALLGAGGYPHKNYKWKDAEQLFDYGFETFPRQVLCRGGKVFRRVPIQGDLVRFVPAVTADDVYYPLMGMEQVSAEVVLKQPLEAPVETGTCIGTLTFYTDKSQIGRTELLAGKSVRNIAVAPQTFFDKLRCIFKGET